MDARPLVPVVCLALLLAVVAPGVEAYTEMYIDGTAAVDGQSPQNPYLWFGPRLGRRKRPDALARDPASAAVEDSLLAALEDTPWALVSLRGLHDRGALKAGAAVTREEEVPDNSKAPPFAPRLGRRRKLLPFSPRLGREMEPTERFERSTEDSKHHS